LSRTFGQGRQPRRLPVRRAPQGQRPPWLEALEDRLAPATYTWNGTDSLSISLGTNESMSVVQAGPFDLFTLSAGVFTQNGGTTAPLGDGTNNLTFNSASVATSLTINNTGAAGTNDVTFLGGTFPSASITVDLTTGGTPAGDINLTAAISAGATGTV